MCHEGAREEGIRFSVKLLEINAEPAIEMTGPRLRWILEELFIEICKTCVVPFFTKSAERSKQLHMCLDRHSYSHVGSSSQDEK